MSKKCMVEREKRKAKLVKKFAAKRKELKEQGNFTALAGLPRDSSPSRKRNRCALTGRPRGVYRKFGLGRSVLRDFVMRGEVPGMTKASW